MQGQIATATRQRYLQSLALCEPHLTGRAWSARLTGQSFADSSRLVDESSGLRRVRRDLTAVSRVLAYAQSVGWREGNPALDAYSTAARAARPDCRCRTKTSIQAVFAECSPHLRNLAVAARLTGARQAELTALKWSQFNETAGTLEIIKGKGNRRRVISLSPAALEHIAKLPRTSDSDLSIGGRAMGLGPAGFRQDGDASRAARSVSDSMISVTCTPSSLCGVERAFIACRSTWGIRASRRPKSISPT